MKSHMTLVLLVGAVVAAGALGADQTGVDDLPDMKEGLWDSSTMLRGATDKPVHSTMCTSNAVSRKMYEDMRRNPDRPCKDIHHERHGSVLTQETECNFNGRITRSTAITTATSNTAIHMETHKADGSIETVIDMKWVSACPANMKLGDVAGPDGKVMMNALAN